jgi:SAM-dependent methyltransferase
MKTVSVLGILHHLHTTRFADTYALDDLAAILRALRPDCVLAELPPGWDERHTAVKEVETRWFFQEHPEHDIWEQHNQLNYEKMLEAIRQRAEARFLITFGLYHKYWFEARLQQERWLHFEPIAEQLNKLYSQRGREHSE